MSATPKPALSSLHRGLTVLDQLIRSGGAPMRFGEIKEALQDVQDSSLARLLQALERFGYLERDTEAGYRLTARVRSWGTYLQQARETLFDIARREVDRLVSEAEESACIALLREDRIEALYAHSVEGGITVIPAGTLLHFEPDHAGALAILSVMNAKQRRSHLAGPFSRFASGETFEECLKAAATNGPALLDQSRARPGVSRLARAFRYGDVIGCVFFCLTLEACKPKQQHLESLLDGTCRRLEA